MGHRLIFIPVVKGLFRLIAFARELIEQVGLIVADALILIAGNQKLIAAVTGDEHREQQQGHCEQPRQTPKDEQNDNQDANEKPTERRNGVPVTQQFFKIRRHEVA